MEAPVFFLSKQRSSQIILFKVLHLWYNVFDETLNELRPSLLAEKLLNARACYKGLRPVPG